MLRVYLPTQDGKGEENCYLAYIPRRSGDTLFWDHHLSQQGNWGAGCFCTRYRKQETQM